MNPRRGNLAAVFGIAFAAVLFWYLGWGNWPDDGLARFLLVLLTLVLMGIGFGIWLGMQDKFWT